MKAVIVGLVLFACWSGQAWARIGETEAQLVTRYGPVVSNGSSPQNHAAPTYLEFKKDIFTIDVWLLDGLSAQEAISRTDNSTYLTDDNIKMLLMANSDGHTWKQTGPVTWVRDDGVSVNAVQGTISALNAPGTIYFVATSRQMVLANKIAQTEAKKAAEGNLNGF